MKVNRLKLIDTFPNPFIENGTGIIEYIQAFNPPWGELEIYSELDMYYYGVYSGNKIISPLIEKLLVNNKILSDDMPTIAKIIYTMFNKKWGKLWNVYNETYNPIENYNMIETGENTSIIEYGKSDTKTDNLAHNETTNDTETPNITETRTPNITRNVSENIYGFDSNSPSPANTAQETNTGNEIKQRTGTNTRKVTTNGTNTGTETTVTSGNDETNTNHTITRHGNIGVTTTQQMLSSEIELWQWNFFNQVLFPDIDRVLVISIYGGA